MKSTIPNLCIKTSKGRQYYVAQVTIDGKRIDRRLGLNTWLRLKTTRRISRCSANP